MNYTEIKELVLAYSDRQDAEVINNLDNFITITEARVNRELTVQKMAVEAKVNCVKDQINYGLPADFAGMRSISIKDPDAIAGITAKYLSPEQMNNVGLYNNDTTAIYYSIIADQLQIRPSQVDKIMQMVYYQSLPNLTSNDATNWLAESSPDVYIFGILVEISSFVKDAEAKAIWDERFKEALSSIISDDSTSRWSGTAMQVRLG